jgi:hypothetical protein
MYYIKERNNPQLGTYYVAMGNMSKKYAKKHESPLYGNNRMIGFKDKDTYIKAIEKMKNEGNRFIEYN